MLCGRRQRDEDEVRSRKEEKQQLWFSSQAYIHVVTEPGAGAVLEPTLVHRSVHNARKHRVPRMLVLHRGIIEAPAPATAAGEGGDEVLL